jgi:hypothetical protein
VMSKMQEDSEVNDLNKAGPGLGRQRPSDGLLQLGATESFCASTFHSSGSQVAGG